MLSQNTSEASGDMMTDGYQGDISSDPGTPFRMDREDINLGAHLQSFLRYEIYCYIYRRYNKNNR